ncbi:MAG: type II toxin-antitoxin system VapC family toxin [Polyangiales bacterium]
MRLLLDTHTFLWWDEGKLPAKVNARIRAAKTVHVSAASAWEISIKAALGKIQVRGSFAEAIADYGFDELPIRCAHAELLRALPPLHRDPFDRMLIAQAIVEGMTLVTKDAAMKGYAVPMAWA